MYEPQTHQVMGLGIYPSIPGAMCRSLRLFFGYRISSLNFFAIFKISLTLTFKNGKSLKYMIRLNNLLDYSEVTSYLCQILKTVGFLHEKLILHSFINTAYEIFQIFSYFLKVELFLNHVLYRTIYVTRNNQIILGGMNFSKQLKSKTDYTRIERHVDKDCHDPYIGFKYDTL